METQYVLMENVIGELAKRYRVPFLSFDSLVELGKRTVAVYHLQDQGKKITFDVLCNHITAYVRTPFGLKMLKSLV